MKAFLIFSLFLSRFCLAQQEKIYSLLYLGEETDIRCFLSLSYASIPSETEEETEQTYIPNLGDLSINEAKRISLVPEMRTRFLANNGIQETDFIFLKNYETGHLDSISIRSLNVFAMISIYTSDSDFPFSPWDYHLGFDVTKTMKENTQLQKNDHVYACIGSVNPFADTKLTKVVWKPTELNPFLSYFDFYYTKTYCDSLGLPDNFKPTSCFKSVVKNYVFIAIELKRKDAINFGENGRYYLVLDAKSKAILFQRVIAEGESTSLPQLIVPKKTYNPFFTGLLLKNKPHMLIGLSNESFGCESIYFLNLSSPSIGIACDNRH